MHVVLSQTHQESSEKLAQLIVDLVKEKPAALICVTSGHSPLLAYQILVQKLLNEGVDYSQVKWVSLDEWVGQNRHDEGSCGHAVYEELFKPLAVAAENFHMFDGREDLAVECLKMDAFIGQNGAVLDLMLVGLGVNGHIGLNEPGTTWKALSHVTTLEQSTIQTAQKYFSGSVELSKGITLGLSYFTKAKKAIMIANGSSKSQIVQRIFTEEPSEKLPASVMRTIDTATLMLDYDAAALIR